jgi:anti-sigma B factor antagonist
LLCVNCCAITLHVDDDQSVVVVAIAGEVDLANAGEVRQLIQRMCSGVHTRIVVDLSKVSFIDSSGLSALVQCQHQAAENGCSIGIVAPDERIRRL